MQFAFKLETEYPVIKKRLFGDTHHTRSPIPTIPPEVKVISAEKWQKKLGQNVFNPVVIKKTHQTPSKKKKSRSRSRDRKKKKKHRRQSTSSDSDSSSTSSESSKKQKEKERKRKKKHKKKKSKKKKESPSSASSSTSSDDSVQFIREVHKPKKKKRHHKEKKHEKSTEKKKHQKKKEKDRDSSTSSASTEKKEHKKRNRREEHHGSRQRHIRHTSHQGHIRHTSHQGHASHTSQPGQTRTQHDDVSRLHPFQRLQIRQQQRQANPQQYLQPPRDDYDNATIMELSSFFRLYPPTTDLPNDKDFQELNKKVADLQQKMAPSNEPQEIKEQNEIAGLEDLTNLPVGSFFKFHVQNFTCSMYRS